MGISRTARTLGPLIGVVALAVAPAAGCNDGESKIEENVEQSSQSIGTASYPANYARQWMTNLANSVKFDGVSPPVAARTYSYAAIAMYEAVVHGMPGYQSLAGQLNGLDSLPQPDPSLEYDWPTVLAQTMNRMVTEPIPDGVHVYPNRIFYEFTTFSQSSLNELGPVQIGFRRTAGVPETTIQNSIAYADELADALIEWMNADGYHELRYKGWIPPKGPEYWVPTGFSDTDKVENPLEPYFGDVRPLVMSSNTECMAPPPPAYSTDHASAMYANALAVYQTDISLTDEQIEIARYWADGPKDTATPAGHWVAIATQHLRNKNLAEATAGYALTSIAYLDAFIAVWKNKYDYNLLRPETYIRRNIRADWRPLLPTPQFPEYVSGHSGLSMAAAVMFEEVFGTGPFVDKTKTRRGFGQRSFLSFTDAAVEASNSRLYGGIHYPVGNVEGRTVGLCVGNAVKTRVHITP